MTSSEINIARTCRSCLTENGNMCLIQESIKVTSSNGCTADDEMSISDLIMACTKVQITSDDGLPQLICTECLSQAQQSFNYKRMCEASDVKLREIFRKTHSPTETVLIKTEARDDFDSIFIPEVHMVAENVDFEDADGPTNDFDDYHSEIEDSESKTSSMATKRTHDGIDEDVQMFHEAQKVDGGYQCGICFKVLSARKTFLLHARLHLQTKLKKCEHCGKGFQKKDQLRRHMATHFKVVSEAQPNKNDDEIPANDFDGKRKDSDTKIRSAPAKQTPVKKRIDDNDEDVQMFREAKQVDGGYECGICGKVLSARKTFLLHSRLHLQTKLKECPQCGRGFAKKDHLRRHMATHSKYFACYQCLEEFGTKEERKAHIANEHPPTKAKPKEEGDKSDEPPAKKKKTEVKSRDRIKAEVNDEQVASSEGGCVPSDEKKPRTPIQHCSICQRGFANGGDLNRHLLSHKTENDAEEDRIVESSKLEDGRYNCPFCVKTLGDRQTFRLHIRLHSGNRLKQCEICQKGFSKQSHLDKHMKVHSDTFSCEQCDEIFQTYRERREHLNSAHKKLPEKNKTSPPEAASVDGEENDDYEEDRIVEAAKVGTDGRYECELCQKTLRDKWSLKFHVRLHLGKRLHKCTICGEGVGFSKKSHLQRHLRTHETKEYKCYHCYEIFDTHQKRKAHMKLVHKDLLICPKGGKATLAAWTQSNGQKKCACMICDAEFDRISKMQKHLLWHSNVAESFQGVDFDAKKDVFNGLLALDEDQQINEHSIAILQQKIKENSPEIAKLYRMTNKYGWELSLTDSESEIDDDVPEKKLIYTCPICQTSFDRLHKVMCHMRAEHEHELKTTKTDCDEFKCSYCSQSYPSALVLEKHLRQQCENQLKKFFCFACNNRFMWQSSLDLHTAVYHNEEAKAHGTPNQIKPKPFQCTECPRSFYRIEHLQTHRENHFPSAQQLTCDVCKKTFNRIKNLRSHMKTHIPLEEREALSKYLCAYCGKACLHMSDLTTHTRRHTGEKPYKCEMCPSSFCGSSDLKRHIRSHTGEKPYECSVCQKRFSRNNKLQRHMRIHTGEKPYKCPHCDKAFTQSNDMNIHVRRHTGDKPYICSCGERYLTNSMLQSHRRNYGHMDEPIVPESKAVNNSVNNPQRWHTTEFV